MEKGIVLFGKARSGKDTCVLLIQNYYQKKPCITIRLKRNNYESELTEKEKRDITEVDLDDETFDYVVLNDENIYQAMKKIVKEV